MAEPARNFEQPHERTAKLHELRLSEATIREAVLRGFVHRQGCTPFHPPSYPGTVQWAETHSALRGLLVPHDWTPDDSRNYSRVVSPDRAFSVTVATGDEHTGRPGGTEPRTKYPKGSETRVAVQTNVNIDQLSLWPSENVSVVETPAQLRDLWILLIATDEHEIRHELSRPNGQDKDGRVVSWSERIIFEPIDIDSISKRRDDDDDADIDGFDVPVERI
jgi:hypothetical protein